MRVRWNTTLALLCGCLLAGVDAHSQNATRGPPELTLDPGGHMAQVNGLLFTRDGKHIISAGDDRVIRVWEWRSGRTLKSMRAEYASGPDGKILAIDLSPDGKLLAVAGRIPGHVIRLFDLETGELTGALRGHIDTVHALSFSRDGRFLLSGGGLADKTAIIWDVAAKTALHRLVGHEAQVYAVAFTLDGSRAVTASFDKTVRFWKLSDGSDLSVRATHTDKVLRLAISPRDGTVASGSFDGEIRLWDGASGRFLKTLANQHSAVGALAFSPDGVNLLSSCSQNCQGAFRAYVWNVEDGRAVTAYSDHDNVITAGAIDGDGRLAATGGGNAHEIHVWELATGVRIRQPDGAPLVLGGNSGGVYAAGFTTDGRWLTWGNTDGGSPTESPYEFRLRLPTSDGRLGKPERVRTDAAEYVRALTTLGNIFLAHRAGGAHGYADAILDLRRQDGTVVSIARTSTDGYAHRSYTLTPDGHFVISGGGSGYLTLYDAAGRKVANFIGHDGDIWAVTPAPGGRYLASGSDDQTLRLWNLQTRELVASLFHGRNGEWIMWTPQGYYAASPAGERMIGWQINRGLDKAAEFVVAEQLREHFYRPDVVERAIELASASTAIEEARVGGRLTSFKLEDLTRRSPPHLAVVAPPAGTKVAGGRVIVSLADLTDLSRHADPIIEYAVYVNDSKVHAEAQQATVLGGKGVKLNVPLYSGRNVVRIVARSSANLLSEETVVVIHQGEGVLDKRETLVVVAIGVDKYPNVPKRCGGPGGSCDLNFAGADARAFATLASSALGPKHRRVESRVLWNGAGGENEPIKANVDRALDLLLKAEENDTVILFVAGHGTNVDPRGYVFLPSDARPGNYGWETASVIEWSLLELRLQAAKGRRLFFVDTCRAANAYNNRLLNDSVFKQIVVYAATRLQQDALELPTLNHGAFTYALIEGLGGKADLDADNKVQVQELGQFVKGRVKQLTKEEQEPDHYKPLTTEDFVLLHLK